MKTILLTGANGYIGKRLLPLLLQNHVVICCVRDQRRFQSTMKHHPNLRICEVDFLKPETLHRIPEKIDVAYFLMHSMASSSNGFEQLEIQLARNFVKIMHQTTVEQVIYLGGINNDQHASSLHLKSRQNVEDILTTGNFHTTTLGAGIIIGSGSSSFEIMRDLVEKLPVMIAPKWLLTKSQYISIKNVLEFLVGVILYKPSYNKKLDIAGPGVLTYRKMLLEFAKVRGLKRWILQVPVPTPKLSSYWLYFVTATSFNLARSLVASMKVEIIAKPNTLSKELNIELIPFQQAVESAFHKIEQNSIVSSWKDSIVSGRLKYTTSNYIHVPTHGCFFDRRIRTVQSVSRTMSKIQAIGGNTGWYYGTWLWELRGFTDKLVGGVGLRRGRTNPNTISTGDSLDFWRVILFDAPEKRLLLYAEMRLPGDAWLEFRITNDNKLIQTATYRPRGLWGRVYWYMVMPFHTLIFDGMINKLAA